MIQFRRYHPRLAWAFKALVLLFIPAILLIEVQLRVAGYKFHIYDLSIAVDQALIRDLKRGGSPPPTHVRTQIIAEPKFAYDSKPRQRLVVGSNVVGDNQSWVVDWDPKSAGNVGRPGEHKIIELAEDGKKLREVVYTIDNFGRRIVPGQSHAENKDAMLLFGDCNIFGYEHDDEETIAYAFTKLQSRYFIYNYGLPNRGLGEAMRLVSLADFGSDIVPKRSGKVLIFFSALSFADLIGDMRSYARVSKVSLEKGRILYGLTDDNQLIERSSRTESLLFSLLSKSLILDYFNINFPIRLTANHFRLYAVMVERIREVLAKKIPNLELYVVVLPHTSLEISELLVDALDKMDIPSINYANINVKDYIEGPVRGPIGNHWSWSTAEFIARQLLADLGITR
jgi:hypothetical protein